MSRNNPFVTKGYGGSEYFCDRVRETHDIISLLINENNLALISPRRMGKTDLIRHCFAQPEIREHYYTFLIDIYATNSLRDFVNVFGKAIMDELKPRGRKVWERFVSTLKSLQAEMSFDINGNPVWGIGMGQVENPAVTLDEIFQYLESAEKPCIIAIDEFQQVTQYTDGQNIEAALRTHVQRCSQTTFLFAGSKRHLMSEIFTSPSRPFYQSVITMGLAPISLEKYSEFAIQKFHEYGKDVEPEVVTNVYSRFHGVTSCLQRVMNVLFMRTAAQERCTVEMVDEAINYLLDLYSENYETQLSQMSERQRTLFRAITAEGQAKNITGGAFIKKYKLWSASSVMSAAKALLDKDFITQEQGAYMVYDQFFALWLLRA
ncbi:MAG: ATP-binding protein [Bacteroidaceae bacterium]|nr:ATP-binding protein [Bacteroidaceae bacterium]